MFKARAIKKVEKSIENIEQVVWKICKALDMSVSFSAERIELNSQSVTRKRILKLEQELRKEIEKNRKITLMLMKALGYKYQEKSNDEFPKVIKL